MQSQSIHLRRYTSRISWACTAARLRVWQSWVLSSSRLPFFLGLLLWRNRTVLCQSLISVFLPPVQRQHSNRLRSTEMWWLLLENLNRSSWIYYFFFHIFWFSEEYLLPYISFFPDFLLYKVPYHLKRLIRNSGYNGTVLNLSN